VLNSSTSRRHSPQSTMVHPETRKDWPADSQARRGRRVNRWTKSLPRSRPRCAGPGVVSGGGIKQSEVAPWFHQPGGGRQYRVIGPDGKNAEVDALLDSGYLGDVRHR
jgi:hypothetical protein